MSRAAPVCPAVDRSRATSRPIVPTLHRELARRGLLRRGARNLDLGGGRFEHATRFLARHGVANLVVDPNLADDHNDRVRREVRGRLADTVTVANTLNVICDPREREAVIREAAASVQPRGVVGFQVYTGDEGGRGRRTRDGWQENRRPSSYLPEIRRWFGRVELVDNLFLAYEPRRAKPNGDPVPYTFGPNERANLDARNARDVEMATFRGIRVFVGQTRSRKLLERLQELGVGEMTVRNEYPPRRHPWVLDNGAFKDWTGGTPFDEQGFMAAVHRASVSAAHPPPEFVVLPDVVADAAATIALAHRWIPWMHGAFARPDDAGVMVRNTPPLAFVVQDGMKAADVLPFVGRVQVIFVGGTVAWKWRTARLWCQFAHDYGMRVHIGRVGTPRLVAKAVAAGADSIDSAYPLWKTEHLEQFMRALHEAEAAARTV